MEIKLCPVCKGNGLVSEGFYSQAGNYPFGITDSTTEQCRSCSGKGWIKVPEDNTELKWLPGYTLMPCSECRNCKERI